MATEKLIQTLQNPDLYPHAVDGFSTLQTHISWVILTGQYVYKIKKPVDLVFLNFTELEQRKGFCEAELRLNKRLAPDTYLDVLPIYGSEDNPSFEPNGEVIEYAIKMLEFPQENRFDNLLTAGKLTEDLIDQVANQLAEFHQKIPVVAADSDLGTSTQVHEPVVQNFDQTKPMLTDDKQLQTLAELKVWAEDEYERIKPYLNERKTQNHIRECHGDVHLGNITLIDNKPVIFDCIEFNEPFRWTDVMADVGFMLMDLYDKKCDVFAHSFLNSYLQTSDDYHGLFILPYYIAYRAMVRAKVSLFRLGPPDVSGEEQAQIRAQYQSCIDVANHCRVRPKAKLILTRGLSGSGKSTIAHALMEKLGCIHLRSDIERKKLVGLEAQAQTESPLYQGIYSPELTKKTYQQLLTHADTCLQAGYSALVDATFLTQQERDDFAKLAQQRGVELSILDCQASEETLQKRVQDKTLDTSDPSEARLDILAAQIKAQEPLTSDEQTNAIVIHTDEECDIEDIIKQLK